MTRPDDKVDRRRALAARAATLAGYTTERIELLIRGAQELGVPVPPEVATFPTTLAAWADTISRVQP